eukprot:293090_1
MPAFFSCNLYQTILFILCSVTESSMVWKYLDKHLPAKLWSQSIGIDPDGTIYLIGGATQKYNVTGTNSTDSNNIIKWSNPPNSEWSIVSGFFSAIHTNHFRAFSKNSVSISHFTYFIGVETWIVGAGGKTYKFDMRTERFVDIDTIPNMPIPSYRGCVATDKISIYYIGGETSSYIQIFNISSELWGNNSLIALPKAIVYTSCAVGINNALYWFGGKVNNSAISDIYQYNITSQIVSTKPIAYLTSERSDSQAIVGPDENIYIIGGQNYDGTTTDIVDIFNVFNQTIQRSIALLESVMGHCVAIVNFSIMVFGGYNNHWDGHQDMIQQSTQIIPAVSFVFPNDNNNRIYPGSTLMFDIKYNLPIQSNIEFDIMLHSNSLNISNIAIKIKNEECIIIEPKNSFDCNQGIKIPYTMQILNIAENSYQLNADYYHSSIFQRNEILLLKRPILNITIFIAKKVVFGENMIVNYRINNKSDDESHLIQPKSYVKLTSTSSGFGLNAHMEIDYNTKQCAICDDGVVITKCYSCNYGIPVDMASNIIGETLPINITSKDTNLEYNVMNITVKSCPLGTSVTASKCIECSFNSYNLMFGDNNCHDCDETNEGYSCIGGSDILISYNYWLYIKNYSLNSEKRFNGISDNETIISSICPPGYCCRKQNKCNLINDTLELCSQNRDNDIPLCGGCFDGYSETYGSNGCKKCSDNYSVLLVPIFVALVYSFVLGYDGCKNREEQKQNTSLQVQSQKQQPTIKDDIKVLKLMLFRSIIYFLQSLYVICSQRGLQLYFSPILKTSMLEIFVSNNNDNQNGICFLSNLNFFGKESFYLFVVFMIFVWLGIVKLLSHFKLINIRCCEYYFHFHFNNAVWRCVLISIGAFTSKMFKFLSCINVGSVTVHFYAGYKNCYEGIWFIALFGVLLSIIGCVALWYKLNIMTQEQRNQYFIIKPYKASIWHWEFVMISRRFLLSFGLIFGYLSFSWGNLIVGIILIVYLLIHWNFYPFLSVVANRLEALCICLSLIGLLCIELLIDEYLTELSFLLSLIVIIPMIFYLYYVVKLIRKIVKMYKKRHSHGNDLNAILMMHVDNK